MRTRGSLTALVVLGAPALLLPLLLWARPAAAHHDGDLTYSYEALWPVALRYVRIDLGAPIKDKDRDGGYVVFDLADGDTTYHCNLQLARVHDYAGRSVVRIAVDLGGLPPYREIEVIDGITAKARAELGPPPDPSQQQAPPDAGAPDGARGAPRRTL